MNPLDVFIHRLSAHPSWIVADMGCGEARLSASVRNQVHSFDLVAANERVVACDIARVSVNSFCRNDNIGPVVQFLCGRCSLLPGLNGYKLLGVPPRSEPNSEAQVRFDGPLADAGKGPTVDCRGCE